MKKIALLNCLKSNRVCAGAACMKAFNNRGASFERYKDEDLELTAFMRCNGCDKPLADDPGMLEKIERLASIGTEIVHIGICTTNKEKEECKLISDTASMLDAVWHNGVPVTADDILFTFEFMRDVRKVGSLANLESINQLADDKFELVFSKPDAYYWINSSCNNNSCVFPKHI